MADQERKTVLTVAAKNDTKGTFQEIKDDATSMAASVEQAGKRAAKGVDGIGDGMDSAAQKFTRGESVIATALQKYIEKTTIATKAGESLSSAFSQKIDLRGLDANKFDPLIQKAKEAEAALAAVKAQQAGASRANAFLDSLREQSNAIGKTRSELLELQAAQLGIGSQAAPMIAKLREAEAGIGKVGMSAAATNAALRSVPAQFTDIVVSLQAGQAPMTVMLQQGGQLKDMFGGVGAAAKALGGYVVGLINPYTVAGAAVGGFAIAMASAEKTLRSETAWQTYAAATGRAADLSTTAFKQLRDEMALMPGVSKTTAGAVIGDLASMRDLSTVSLKGIASIAADVAVVMRTDMPAAAKAMGKAFEDPGKGILELNDTLKIFTAEQIATVQAMAEAGNKAGAQAVMFDALKQSTQGLADQGMTPLQRATNDFGNSWDKAISSLNGAGGSLRAANELMAGLVKHTAEAVAWLSKLRLPKEFEDLFKGGLNGMVFGAIAGTPKTPSTGGATGAWGDSTGGASGSFGAPEVDARTKEWNEHIAVLRKATDGYKATSDQIDKLKGNAKELGSAIAKLDAEGKGGGDLAKQLRENLAGVNEQLATLAKRGNSGGGGIKISDNQLANLQSQLEGAKQYGEQLRLLGAAATDLNAGERESLKLSAQIERATDAKTIAKLKEAKATADALGQQLRSNDGFEKSLKAQQALVDANYKDADAIVKRAEAQEAANSVYGQGRTAIEQMTLATLEHQMAEAQASDSFDPKYIASLEQKIAAQKRWITALDAADYKKLDDQLTKSLEASKQELSIQQQSMGMLGMEEVQRKAIVAQRKIELDVAKQLAEVDKLYQGRTDDKSLQEAEDAKRKIREKGEIDTQIAIGKIQEDYAYAQAAKYNDVFRQGFADFVNNGTAGLKAFGKSLKTTVLTSVADALYQAFAQRYVVNLVASITGGFGGGAMGAVGSAGQMASGASNLMNGGMTNWTNMGTAAADWMWNNGISMVNNGFTSVGGAMMDFSGTISNVDTWFKGIGLEGGLGSAVGYLGSVVALAKGDYGAAIGSAIGTYILPGIGTMIGSWLGSAIGGLFGRKLKESGIEGEFGGESGFEGRLYKYYKGGLFRSNKTTYEDMPEEMRKGLGDQFLTMDKAIRDMAGAVGLGGEALDGFTAKFKVDLKDLSPEEATKKLQEEFQKIAEQMGALVFTSEEYTRAGETQLEALTRLSGSITLANEWFKAVGDTLITVGLSGADMASELIDAFGGADKFLSATSKYYDKFFSDEEKVANQTRLLQDALKKLGVDAMPMSRQALRDYINSIDVSTEAGRKLYAALIGMADAFDVVYSAAEQAEAALRSSQEAYYDKFYSDAENQQRKMEEVNKTFEGLGLTVPRSREEFRKMVDGIDRSTEAGQKLYKMLLDMSGVFDELYTASDNAMQQMVDMLAEIAGIKDDLTLDLLRAQGNDAEATRREREKKLAELEKYKDPSVIQLQKDVWAAQDKAKADEEAQKARDAAEAAAQKAYDAAYAMAMKNLQGAVGREKEYWDKFVSDAKTSLEKAASFFTLVTNAAASLRDPIEDVLAMQAAAGMVYIENALERARQGLGLPDYDQTDKAINAASSGLVMDYFGSQVELDYEKKVLAGQLDELGKYADTQKTDAEKLIDAGNAQIERLDGILDFWNNYGQESIDATLSVADAVNAMAKLAGGGSTSTGGGSVGSGSSGGSSGSSGGSSGGSSSGGASLGGSVAGSSKYPTIIGFDAEGRAYYSDGSKGVKPGEYDASGVSKNAALSEDQWERLKAGQSVYDGYWLGGKQYGLEMYDWDPSKQMYVKRPSFDVGTNFVPYDMKANLHAGERVIPRADNKALIAALEGGGNAAQLAEVVAELREVKAKLAAIEENTGAGASFGNQTAEILKEVTEGGNAMRTLDMADTEPAR